MRVTRLLSKPNDPYAGLSFIGAASRIVNPNGAVVFEHNELVVPSTWNQIAIDVLAQKYMRKAGVPSLTVRVPEEGIPEWLQRSVPAPEATVVRENDARQVFERLAGCWTYWGFKHNYFSSELDARAYFDEMCAMLARQMGAPNSPQFFNTGLFWAYGCHSDSQGQFHIDPSTAEIHEMRNAYEAPNISACFPAGTLITTRDGFKAIEDIRVGDQVATHLGRFRAVTATMNRVANGGLVEIRAHGASGAPLRCTSEHPIYVVKNAVTRLGGAVGEARAFLRQSLEAEWAPAKDVTTQDAIVLSVPNDHETSPPAFDLAEYVVDRTTRVKFEVDEERISRYDHGGGTSTIQRVIAFNRPRTARLLGHWLGDGSIITQGHFHKAKGISFVFNREDVWQVTEIQDLMREVFGVDTEPETFGDQGWTTLRYYHVPIARFFFEHAGQYSWGKRVPAFVYSLSRAHKLEFLAGLWNADGCLFERKRNSTALCWDFSNKELAYGVIRVLRSLGIRPALCGNRPQNPQTSKRNHYRISVGTAACPDLCTLLAVDPDLRRRPVYEGSFGALKTARIQSVTTVPFTGVVYNLQVAEDESYAANGFVVHNCFITKIEDNLVNESGIMDFISREARIFKFGSGNGASFSKIRAKGEKLSGGGSSSGLMSFLKVPDRSAGAIKSGGTTRRAAKMVVLDIDHPDIEEFITWKIREEQKVADLVAGSIACEKHLNAILAAASDTTFESVARQNPEQNPALREALRNALNAGIPTQSIRQVLDLAPQGFTHIDVERYTTDWEGEAYNTVSGQNSNNSVRMPNAFFASVDADGEWNLTARTTGEVMKSLRARDLWEQITLAAWKCADPGLQFSDTINEWHTLRAIGPINASNPCGEYLSIDDSSCFTADTRISTPNGLRTVEHLYRTQQSGETVMITTDILNETDYRRITTHRPATVTQVGVKPVVDLQLSGGRSIKVTPDHRFLTSNGWKRVDQLIPEIDRVEIRRSGDAIRYSSDPADIRRWQMLGWLSGDGVFNKNIIALVFGPRERQTAEVFAEEFHTLKIEAAGGQTRRTSRISTQTRNGVMQVSASHETMVQHLERKYGFHQGTAVFKDVPTAIHTVSNDLKVAYLQGLFSADGSIFNDAKSAQPKVTLSSSAPKLLRSVQLILSDLGITSNQTWTRSPGRTNAQGALWLHGVQAKKFCQLVGFACSPEKTAKAHKWLTDGIPIKETTTRAALVKSVIPIGNQTVYDITEPVTHSLIAEGLIAHNCNLASLNLTAFLDEKSSFSVDLFKHATRLWTLTLELSVLCASFPDRKVAQNTFAVRNLGLGYANLGTLLMRLALPYDSTDAFGWCAAITALMAGQAYATSSEIALHVGPFPAYEQNKEHMLRVLRNHARAAGLTTFGSDYEGLTVKPIAHSPTLETSALWNAARDAWAAAITNATDHGVRNAQTVVIAPTGTISLEMGCDTSGIEPDFALVKFKKLAGGGYFKIVNESVATALRKLGYTQKEIDTIEVFAKGTQSLSDSPHINAPTLRAKGLSDDDLAKINAALPTAFKLEFAFNPNTMPDYFRTHPEIENPWNVNVLRDLLGFTQTQVIEATDVICGRMSLEGAPLLKDEHLPIFDCATPCGEHGSRYIRPLAHIDMVAAAQPFVSGGISKSVNMPQHASIQDVGQAYRYAWERMVKSITVYRDGSKLSQPLSSNYLSDTTVSEAIAPASPYTTPVQIAEKIVYRYITKKRSLPSRRSGYTQKINIGGHKVFLKTGEYGDGSLGEIFIDMHKEGAAFRAMMNNFAIAVSLGLQHGVPLEEFVDKFTFTKFEPNGIVTGHENLKMSTSIIDCIFRDLAITYLGRYELAHIPPTATNDPTEIMPEYNDEREGDTRIVPAAQPDLHRTNGHVTLGDRNSNGADKTTEIATVTQIAANGAAHATATDRRESLSKGYSGDICFSCGSASMVRSGTCLTCSQCGSTSQGCS